MIQMKIEDRTGIIIIHLSGELTFKTTPELKGLVKKVIINKPRLLVFDMSRLNFIGAECICYLIELSKYSLLKNFKLVLIDMNEQILDLLKICEIDYFFKIMPGELFQAKYMTEYTKIPC